MCPNCPKNPAQSSSRQVLSCVRGGYNWTSSPKPRSPEVRKTMGPRKANVKKGGPKTIQNRLQIGPLCWGPPAERNGKTIRIRSKNDRKTVQIRSKVGPKSIWNRSWTDFRPISDLSGSTYLMRMRDVKDAALQVPKQNAQHVLTHTRFAPAHAPTHACTHRTHAHMAAHACTHARKHAQTDARTDAWWTHGEMERRKQARALAGADSLTETLTGHARTRSLHTHTQTRSSLTRTHTVTHSIQPPHSKRLLQDVPLDFSHWPPQASQLF